MNSVGLVPVRRTRDGIRVLWSRRPDDRAWFGGFWGLPVGRVREQDAAVPLANEGDQLPSAAYGCAARELFEELGLMAVDGEWLSGDRLAATLGVGGELQALRRDVRTGSRSFANLLESVGVPADVDVFHPAGAWETPGWFEATFSTEFFAVTVPDRCADRAIDEIDASEHLEAGWRTPAQALEGWRAGRDFVTTPIRLVLETLEHGEEWRWADDAADDELVVTRDWLDGSRLSRKARRHDIEIARGVRWMALLSQTLTPSRRTNCWILGRQQIVVIDPGTPYRRERETLADTLEAITTGGAELAAVVLTHHHDDHAAAAGWLAERQNMPIWCHSETANRLGDDLPVARELSDGDHIELGADRRLETLHTPGHAPGHLAFELQPEGHVVAGDMIARGTTVLIDPKEGDMGEYLESLERLRRVDARSLLPGHGHPMTDANGALDWLIAHRRERESQILEALIEASARTGRPVTPAELVPIVYDHTPRRRWPLATRSLEAHLLHLVERGEAKRRDEGFWTSDDRTTG